VLLAILHFIDDSEDPHAIVARLVEAMPSGSYLVMSHATYDPMPSQVVAQLKAVIARTGEKGGPATGTSSPALHRPRTGRAGHRADRRLAPHAGTATPDPADVGVYGAVARIP